MLFSFEGAILQRKDPPELIPNSEVKHFRGEDSWACPCEHSSLPGPFFLSFSVLCMAGSVRCLSFLSPSAIMVLIGR